jgi:hypothetical protein
VFNECGGIKREKTKRRFSERVMRIKDFFEVGEDLKI